MSIFVLDSFGGTGGTLLTAHTGEVGATWSAQPGSGGGGTFDYQLIGNGKVRGRSVSDFGQLIASGVPSSPNYVVRATLTQLTQLGTESVQIQGRSSGSESTMYAAGLFGNDQSWHLWRVVAGVFTELAPARPHSLADGISQLIELSVRGNKIQLLVNGSAFMTAHDDVISAAGFAGLGGGLIGTESDSTGRQWSNFVAETVDEVGYATSNKLRPRIFAPGLAR